MKRFALLAAFGLFLTAAPASAQLAVYGGGGSAIPTGDDLDGVEAGLQLLGGFTYDMTERVALFAEGQWGTHDLEDTEDVTVKPSALMGGLLLSLSSDEDAPISPYLFGGLGLQSVKLDSDAGDADDRTFGYQFGAGVGFDLGSLPAFLEGRYQGASFDADSDIGELDFSIFSIILGFSFDIGGDN